MHTAAIKIGPFRAPPVAALIVWDRSRFSPTPSLYSNNPGLLSPLLGSCLLPAGRWKAVLQVLSGRGGRRATASGPRLLLISRSSEEDGSWPCCQRPSCWKAGEPSGLETRAFQRVDVLGQVASPWSTCALRIRDTHGHRSPHGHPRHRRDDGQVWGRDP